MQESEGCAIFSDGLEYVERVLEVGSHSTSDHRSCS